MTARITAISAQGSRLVVDGGAIGVATLRDRARDASIRWIKQLRLVDYDGEPMRDRFKYGADSLWWFTEIYLHKMRRLERAVETVLTLDLVAAAHEPARLLVESGDDTVRAVAAAFAAARGLPVDVAGATARQSSRRWSAWLVGASARFSRLRAAPRPAPPRRAAVAAFVHTAFWRTGAADDAAGQDVYIGPVLDAVAARVPAGDLAFVGVGPRRNFRARRWWDPITATDDGRPRVTAIERFSSRDRLAGALELWRQRDVLARAVTTGDAIRDAARFHGCDLWPVLAPALEGAATVQWPWSARAIDEAAAALEALRPRVAVTYAEAGGWGRALVLAARRRDIPSVGLQHGFIYRHWLNYRHETDEMAAHGDDPGFPRPDRTLVFDRYAADYLERAGGFAAASLAVTGSPRLDELAAATASLRSGRDAIRRELGVEPGGKLAVLTAKHAEVRAELAALVAAVTRLNGLRLVIKAHPAEPAGVYVEAGDASAVSVLPASADLARLLAAADVLVTMNSTVAIDALVLGVPAVVLGVPNNLSPFVDAGAMIGVTAGSSPQAALESVLYDEHARARVVAAAAAFAARFEMRTSGQAADRAAEAILSLRG